MLANFSWLQYGIFTGLSLLVYYSVILLLFYRTEIRTVLSAVASKAGKLKTGVSDAAAPGEESTLVGKAMEEDGMSSVSLDDLDFGNEQRESKDQLLQGDLADCMEELNFTIGLAKEKSWNKAKLSNAFTEIAESYLSVFQSKLRPQLLEFIVFECSDKLPWATSIEELEELFARKVSGWGKIAAAGAAVFAFMLQVARAQDGNQGISEATNKVKGYFDTGTSLMYAIGAIMGLVGAVKVYSKWNAGEPDTTKVATAWFGSCIFLVVVATVLKSFFGI